MATKTRPWHPSCWMSIRPSSFRSHSEPYDPRKTFSAPERFFRPPEHSFRGWFPGWKAVCS